MLFLRVRGIASFYLCYGELALLLATSFIYLFSGFAQFSMHEKSVNRFHIEIETAKCKIILYVLNHFTFNYI